MPEENNNFESKLILALEAQGVEDVYSAFNRIMDAQTKAGNSVDDLIKQYGSVSKTVKVLVKDYQKYGSVSKKAISDQSKLLRKNIKLWAKQDKIVREASDGLKSLVLPPSPYACRPPTRGS